MSILFEILPQWLKLRLSNPDPIQLSMKGLRAYDPEGHEVFRSPFPKQGEVWMLDGYELLIGQVEFPYLCLYNKLSQTYWAGHIDNAGDIYKVEETWLMKEVRKQTKTLGEFVNDRQNTPG